MSSNATHVAIDPFQRSYFRHGVLGAQRFEQAWPSVAPHFVHLNETASVGLAWLLKRRQCFDLFFMDDGYVACPDWIPYHEATILTGPMVRICDAQAQV